MRALAVLILLCSTAYAEAPGETPLPQPAITDGDTKSIAGAYAVTALGTIVPLTIAALGTDSAGDLHPTRAAVFGSLGIAALVLGPSVGHWYAGEGVTTGLVIRTAAAAGVAGIVLAGPDRSNMGLLVVGGIVTVGAWETGLIWDLATLPRAVRRYNQRHRLQLAPLAAPHTSGLALAGTF